MTEVNEADLKAALVKRIKLLLPGSIVLRHEDIMTAGIPDISVTWKGYTTWLEVKLMTPRLRGKGVQNLTCLRLAEAGRCWYVIYVVKDDQQYTFIVHPSVVKSQHDIFGTGHRSEKFNHDLVAEFIRDSHDPDEGRSNDHKH